MHHLIKIYVRETAGMSTLYVGRLRSAMCEVFKAVNNIDSEYHKKYFTLKDYVYEARTVMPLIVPKFSFCEIQQEKS